MRADNFTAFKSILNAAIAAALVLAAGTSHAAVSLIAAPTSTALPDGQTVPMWGYTCGAPDAVASCEPLNPNAGGGWSPVVITVPYNPSGTTVQIALTNHLSFAAAGGTTNNVPTSLVIVGQVGGGLGNLTQRTTTPSPLHTVQGATTWPVTIGAGTPFTPPAQAPRVQSFATEVAAGQTTTLTWTNLRPGTYLIESGTHPSIQGPMGLYGVLVVTTPVAGGTPERVIRTRRNRMVVTKPGTPGSPGTAYPATSTSAAVTYNAEIPMLLSEIDPVQNSTVDAVVRTHEFSETAVRSGQPGKCGNAGAANYETCYPAAVNYDPRYYLINGVSFDRAGSNAMRSVFATDPPTATGNVLVRFVNAGLRMHVPSIVGAETVDTSSGAAATVSGMAIIAEDGNVVPGNHRIQSELFMAAGKTNDVLIKAPAVGNPALPVFDRALSLSTNNARDGGMQAYVQVNGGTLPFTAVAAVARPDSYYLVAGNALIVPELAKGVMANDTAVYRVQLLAPPASGTVVLNQDGTFSYTPNAGTISDSFSYCANGTVTATATGSTCSSNLVATVTLNACTGACVGGAPTANGDAYTSNIASLLHISPPGVLANDTDPSGLPLTATLVGAATGGTVTLNADGSFTAVPTTPPTGAGTTATVSFQYNAVNSQHTASGAAKVTVTFKGGSGITVAVKDAPTGLPITDYRWIIEEDRTFYIDPACQVNSPTRPAGCPPLPVPALGVSFHTSFMPVVAQGCVGTISCEAGQTMFDPNTGLHVPAVCDTGNGVCHPGAQQPAVDPSQVALDPTKRYYISILPGDAGNPFHSGAGAPVGNRQFSIALDCGTYSSANPAWTPGGTGVCGHGMGGVSITPSNIPQPTIAGAAPGTPVVVPPVVVPLQETPFPTAKVSVFVFEDDSPLNGENDAVGLVDSPVSKEPGLGGFEVIIWDDAGSSGQATGQMTYDMFNMPLSNSLAGMVDPTTGLNACPITTNTTTPGIVGMIVTCPTYESDGKTPSPLAGQAVVANLMPGRYGIAANPGSERVGRGEEWLQTNTLDGQKAHDAFIKIGGPAYFQEFGPANYHVSIGFANPAIINARLPQVCAGAGANCTNTVTGRIVDARISRTPDQRLYGSGSHDALSFTNCYVSLGGTAGDDIAFTKCNADGTFSLSGIPDGNWRMTIFDQWNDQIVDGLSTPVTLKGGMTMNLGDIQQQQWHSNLYTRTFFDLNGDGVSQANEPGLALVPTNIRFRDGSMAYYNNTDLNGYAPYNELFPLFAWYVLEADTTRYKQTGVHTVYDVGGPADGTPGGGTSTIAQYLANTNETIPLPANLRVPGAVYCSNADCAGFSIANGAGTSQAGSSGRIDPPWVTTEGWQGFIGNAEFIEFGKAPFAVGENGGIRGEVVYASTRAFDDPTLTVHTSWMPNVAGVTVNLYQEGTAPDGTQSLKLVDTTTSSSWDDWAQGVRTDGMPNMSCPGQDPTSPFYFTLQNSTQWLYPTVPLPNNSQFKCYDGLAVFNQVQPAPYDGMYQFPSVTTRDPVTGKPTHTNCTACIPNPADGNPMLPPGKYVVEVIVPPGYELMKEEDKNILIGDNFIAPVTQQFAGLGNIFIMPDQATVNSNYNAHNAQNPTTNFGNFTAGTSGGVGMDEQFWPCVGTMRIVPDYLSIFPGAQEVSPFAGASRNLCDRKEVTLTDQTASLAKFYIFSSTHIASHFTGIITDDLASEFDPFSPQFGEKFAVPNLPISFKDFTGNEVARIYSDQWGDYNGLNYSTWEVNPPNPTGYAPTMMVACMNDPGPILDTRQTIVNYLGQTVPNPTYNTMITDPSYNPNYSQFCYELPFMPGRTAYLDTPVVPTAGFAEGYNPVDCAYPNLTPAIKSVNGNGIGPWVSGAGGTLTITALGDQNVPNNAYTGPQATTSPFNQKFITRHYGFGATAGTVTIGGVPATVNGWSDLQITVTVPNIPATNSTCPIQQQGAGGAACGELVITTATGQPSVDTVTVTVGGKAPTYVNGENATNNAIQTAIDNAAPGDLIMVGPGTYNEMLLMWKPVRLQGVGAASVTVNASPHPSGKLDPWRRQVACLFGIALNGAMISAGNPYDPSGTYICPATMQGQVDPLPLEAIIGWGPLNANPGELLQEPMLMGAYEGAGITILGKGWSQATSSAEGFTPTVMLTNTGADCTNYPSNFLCNPSRVDGITFTSSNQGGGAIFAHGWNHYLEIANNRIYANAGTLSGGITIGQLETAPVTIQTTPLGVQQQLPLGFNHHIHVHNNYITSNASYGDELFASMDAAAGGATFCTGTDYYKFDYNWVCGNLSTGGGGLNHEGFSYNGNISHNWILFNQSNNPTIPTNGGGIAVVGGPEGAGPALVIDSNVIMGNTAESGSGGGMRLQGINGEDVVLNPTDPTQWYGVTISNNIIANNVAGWDGGGVSMQDALKVNFVHNTVVANDTTASSGVLFGLTGEANGAPQPLEAGQMAEINESALGATTATNTTTSATTTASQAAGLVTMRNTPNLMASLPQNVTCPSGYGYDATGTLSAGGANGPNGTLNNGTCRQVSLPLLDSNIFWQNRPFYIQVGGLGTGLLSQQNLVTLMPNLNQASTGQCVPGASYWDIGIRGDLSPMPNSGSGFALSPTNSVLTSTAGYNGSNVQPGGTPVVLQYCNGSRVPPENGGMGYLAPPGIADALAPNPLFSLTPAATVDEGNNWINMSYGPLTLFNPLTGVQLGNYNAAPGYITYGAARGTFVLP